MGNLDETIVAIQSPSGGAARGIVRVSGPSVLASIEGVFRAGGPIQPGDVTRPSSLAGELCLESLSSRIPCELYLWPGRRSYTGEPVAELHTLGSPPLLDLIVDQICAAEGVRLAQPGEFTLRAFLSGRIDLTQAEAVLGVIDAGDQDQLDVALTQLAGGLARPLNDLRDSLIDLLGHLEAGFDFADEDLPFIAREELHRQLSEAARKTRQLARRIHVRATAGAAARVALYGWPNAGKSSLFNALIACSETPQTQAIVSHHAGTTRDYLTAELDIDGVHCCLVDTAGIDSPQAGQADNELPGAMPFVERESQQIAVTQAQKAEVRVLCIDSAREPNGWEKMQIEAYAAAKDAEDRRRRDIVVYTKCDAARERTTGDTLPLDAILTSSITDAGIAELRRRIRAAVSDAEESASAVVAPTAVRCRQSVRMASESLARACKIAEDQIAHDEVPGTVMPGEELIAAELRVALDELGKVVGTVYTDDVLDRIFSRFCIGK